MNGFVDYEVLFWVTLALWIASLVLLKWFGRQVDMDRANVDTNRTAINKAMVARFEAMARFHEAMAEEGQKKAAELKSQDDRDLLKEMAAVMTMSASLGMVEAYRDAADHAEQVLVHQKTPPNKSPQVSYENVIEKTGQLLRF